MRPRKKTSKLLDIRRTKTMSLRRVLDTGLAEMKRSLRMEVVPMWGEQHPKVLCRKEPHAAVEEALSHVPDVPNEEEVQKAPQV